MCMKKKQKEDSNNFFLWPVDWSKYLKLSYKQLLNK